MCKVLASYECYLVQFKAEEVSQMVSDNQGHKVSMVGFSAAQPAAGSDSTHHRGQL